jgi:hypothetical protein
MDVQLPTELRHAYRALLRAVTYLPDAAAREYLHSYVVYRFRRVADTIRHRNNERCMELIRRYHGAKNIAKARQAARQLERAGLGSSEDLKRVLMLTYGRTGKRRRELVADLMKAEESTLPQDQNALEELIHKPPAPQEHRFPLKSKIMVLIRSQQTNQPAEVAGAVIRRVSPNIPATNIWGRPLPLKLRRSITERHWAATLDKVLPPLPEHEWNRLRDLARGVIPVEMLRPRRSNSGRRPAVGEENDAKVLQYFTTPANMHTTDFDEVRVETEQGATCWAMPFKEVEIPRAHTGSITTRYMRRLYANIWNMTPTMSQDPVTGRWITKWGETRSPAHAGKFTRAASSDMEFWEGLNVTKHEQVARP